MTFTEAALEVLRTAGEPLHYKRITELAIERNLLSHVGKTPEVTMSSRLAMMVKKDRGQAPIIKVKPGVFAIRESALQDLAAAAAAAAAIEAEAAAQETSEGAEPQPEQKPPVLPGADVFPEEEGDDDPILAGLEQEGDAGDRAGRRRRRRRRRGKGSDKGEAVMEGGARAESPREATRERDRDRPQEGREPRDGGREPRDGGRERRDFDRPRNEEAAPLDWNRQPGDGDLLGRDLADAVWLVLSRGERAPHPFARVAELLVRRGRLSGNPAALAPTIAAAVRADISRAELSRARPRFRIRAGRLWLVEWQLGKSLARAEQELLSATERHGAELRRTLLGKLADLPAAGFAELVATWLNAEGVTALRALRRPGSSSSEFHFAGTRKRGSEETRLAIVVQRGGRDVDREAVIAVRGALHHYANAQCAWIVTTGRITSGAREEANMQAAAPVALFEGMAVATAMERLGVAVRSYSLPHYEIDYDLLEALGDTSEQRREREPSHRDRNGFGGRDEARGSHERRERAPAGPRAARAEPRAPHATTQAPTAEARTNDDGGSLADEDDMADEEVTIAEGAQNGDERDWMEEDETRAEPESEDESTEPEADDEAELEDEDEDEDAESETDEDGDQDER